MTEVEIGSDFVGYRVEESIGRGGMGVVYRAYDLRLKRPVALKFITPELALDERFRARFARETELVMSLEHPNVVPIYDAGDVDSHLYLAMRLVVGADLRRLLRGEGALEPARALAVCRQVASALDAGHARGLVHRDVKPSNVLLDENEHAYLADFGLTRRLDEQNASVIEGGSLGTLAYIAPEQIESKPVDGRADVYSLGCMLFECLTATPPYAGSSRLETAWAHLEQEPPRASSRKADLPEAVDRVLATALAKEPEDRYPTCTELISATEEAFGFRKARLFERPKLVLAAAAILIAIFAAAAVATLLATGGPGKAAAPLFAHANTLARIDPLTDRVSAVIDVGTGPAAGAAAGHSAWVYNRDDSTISEIDVRGNHVRNRTAVSGTPAECCSDFAGPVLAADASGAWFVSGDRRGKALLTHLAADARGKREYRLDITPTGVAVGEGAVWVVGRGAHDYQLLHIDPATGHVTAWKRFPASAPIDSVAAGFGYVWVVGSADATLYRIDPGKVTRTSRVVVGHPPAARPQLMSYEERRVYVPYTTKAGSMAQVDPFSLSLSDNGSGGPPDGGENLSFSGSDWFDSWQAGSVFRQRAPNGPTRRILIVANVPTGRGPCLTSMASGAGSVWVTVAPSTNYTCRF